MKYVMKTLRHNGIYVPPYEYKGFSITARGVRIKLQPKSEQMSIAWVRKAQSATAPPDKTYYTNFIKDFLGELKLENPSLEFLDKFEKEHAEKVETGAYDWFMSEKSKHETDIDFSEIADYLIGEQTKKLSLTKEEKKQLSLERKAKRETLKEKYGYAFVDNRRIEIANWTAEPSCLFAGRGEHPKRGKWKEGPAEKEITLNLSPDAPLPEGNWKEVIWQPDKMFIAKWTDRLFGKVKYVWFSDSAFLKQSREKEKFKKAEKLSAKISQVEAHILKNLNSQDEDRRKVATVSWLLLELNMRVGDEKDPGEADTVGAITLRPEHIMIQADNLHFDFLGKDCVRWVKDVKAPDQIIENIKKYSAECKEYLFEGIDSKRVTRFLSEAMKGLTAKVFRTWKCTVTVKNHLDKAKVKRSDPEYLKKFIAKMANLEAAKIANHKRKIPVNFNERLAKKEVALKDLKSKLRDKTEQRKKTDTLVKRIDKSKLDLELMRQTEEYNLGTSLKSYIDPNVYVAWSMKVQFRLDKFYPKTLLKKYSWALRSLKTETEAVVCDEASLET